MLEEKIKNIKGGSFPGSSTKDEKLYHGLPFKEFERFNSHRGKTEQRLKQIIMKDFKNVKIAAIFCCHDNEKYLKKSLDAVMKYVNFGLFINLNDATDAVERIVLSYPHLSGTIKTTNKGSYWSQMKVRDDTIRMLDNIKPDIVLFFDDDETPPPNLKEQLKIFWDDTQKKTFWFNGLYMWGDEHHFRRDGLYKSMWNCRIFKWQEDITYYPRYAGMACPTTFADLSRETKYFSNMPLKHWGYMTEEDRALKYKRNNSHACDSEFRKKRDKNIIIRELPKELYE